MINGRLFTIAFLQEGIVETVEWQSLDEAIIDALMADARAIIERHRAIANPKEAQTEKDVIFPLLDALGWKDKTFVQPNLSAKGRADVPDALLCLDDEAVGRAGAESQDFNRFQHAIALVESKRWERELDRAIKGNANDPGVPSSQILRYLRRADDYTRGALRWGILTNGRIWRLYWHGALSVTEDFLEIDLIHALGIPGYQEDILGQRRPEDMSDADWRRHVFKLFVLMFGRNAFAPSEKGRTFHQIALDEGRFWERRVANGLSDTVFEKVYPRLVAAIGQGSGPQWTLEEIRQGALILLYRLLFILYAEDRNLLPDETGPYADYCLTRTRQDIAAKKGRGATFSATAGNLWGTLTSIFGFIARGDDAMGIPPYNGGLFEATAAPILEAVRLGDADLAETIFGLSHIEESGGIRGPQYVNYRDLSVQQLGAVYERLLEFDLARAEDGTITVIADDAARHTSGSYYTSDDLVMLVIERTVGPSVDAVRTAFEAKATALRSDRRAVGERIADLQAHDFASALLDLKVCDPAMGSGHFLVNLVDWLSSRVLDAMEEAASLANWAERTGEGGYISPLAARIAEVREKILAEARARKWPIVEAQLDDRHIVRRMVLKRVVYGVDKNPMAVELAKVALWLHSFTVGAPLSFLDHHLRCGDSVLGLQVRQAVGAMESVSSLFPNQAVTRVEQVAAAMDRIETITDNDIAEVEASKSEFAVVEDATLPVDRLFDLIAAERLLGVMAERPKKAPVHPDKMAGKSLKDLDKWAAQKRAFERASVWESLLAGDFGDPLAIAIGQVPLEPQPSALEGLALDVDGLPASEGQMALPGLSGNKSGGAGLRRKALAARIMGELAERAKAHGFLHWQIAFPNVWRNLLSAAPQGGFDAVIGNPPYVRQELLGPEVKRALKASQATFDGMADLYVYFYEQGLRLLKPGGRMGYVVTNKWLKAGYAEELRGHFAEKAWLEFVADFGHAKHFFPDADVFPSVLVARQPVADQKAPEEASICAIPRDDVPRKGLSEAVLEATFPMPRATFTRESWVLEPKPVMDLLAKIRANGVPLADYAGVKPLYGIKTGFNEAFLINQAKRDALVAADPACAEIIKPYLRGQDIERWSPDWSGLWMIFARRGIEIERYPSLLSHLSSHRAGLEPKPANWVPRSPNDSWLGRKEGNYRWFEIQDPVDYWEQFLSPKLIYQVIQFAPQFAFDADGYLGNDKTFILPTERLELAAVLNSPIIWWHNWRYLPHLKDEALSPMGYLMEALRVPQLRGADIEVAVGATRGVIDLTSSIRAADKSIHDWLRHEHGLEKPGRELAQPHLLNADSFVAAVRKALPKSRKLSAAMIAELKREHADTIAPARQAASEALALERKLSDLVNAAYGLTPEDIALMWQTAPPRMPFLP